MRVVETPVSAATGRRKIKRADVRVISSSDDGEGRGLRLEQPPDQPFGGGLNSSLVVDSVNVGTPLAPGASVTVGLRLDVRRAGGFGLIMIAEAAR